VPPPPASHGPSAGRVRAGEQVWVSTPMNSPAPSSAPCFSLPREPVSTEPFPPKSVRRHAHAAEAAPAEAPPAKAAVQAAEPPARPHLDDAPPVSFVPKVPATSSKAAKRLKSFREGFQAAALRVLGRLPGTLAPTTFVLGIPAPGNPSRLVRVAPPDAPFAAVLPRIEERIAEMEREGSAVHVGPSSSPRPRGGRAKLGLGRAEVAVAAAAEVLKEHGRRSDRRSFCAGAVRLLGHYVVPVLQVRRDAYEALPALRTDARGLGHGVHGFADAVIAEILREAEEELYKPRPGKSLYWLDPDVIARAAGTALLFEAAAAGHGVGDAHALLDRLNVVSATRYERRVGRGRIVIARPDHPAVRSKIRLAAPISLGDPGWTRKMLEMASDGVALLSDSAHVLGLGAVSEEYDPSTEDLFVVEFVDHYKWELRHADAVLMRVEYGIPGLPHPKLHRAALGAVVARVFPATPVEVDKRLWRIVETAMEQPHGTTIVVSAEAETEAERLTGQSTRIEPVVLGEEMIRRATSIDGALLLDAEGRCHAIGAILDGRAAGAGRPARGARYNSALRYVSGAGCPTLAVVISEDGRVDVLPDG
jgi:DisA bacterial checkpoint controller nucleotide-binding